MLPERVPVVEINKNNLNLLWPSLLIAIRRAQLISIDLELSGLGNRSGLTSKSFEDRYENIRKTTQTHSIFSIGISTFELKEISENPKRIEYDCQVFNILAWSEMNFTVEPEALIFLSGHHFDFNKLINEGLRYAKKGNDTLHILFEEILSCGVSLCFHNGLIDLMFIYQHFYEDLPTSSSAFLANLSDWFTPIEEENHMQSLLLDSKYIAEYSERTSASFLEYIFRKYQRVNFEEFHHGKVYLDLEFPINIQRSDDIEWIECQLPMHFINKEFHAESNAGSELCQSFANHGYCHNRMNGKCVKLHDVDLILDAEEKKARKERERRKRRYEKIKRISYTKENLSLFYKTDENELRTTEKNMLSNFTIRGSHRAGMDSFMTGFATLFPQRMTLFRTKKLDAALAGRLPLAGKKFPLQIQKSAYANQSEKHVQKWARIRAKRAAFN
uniref:Uncharacterized protein n=1 Tax=Acrobeloides nanus TaxID=290746 RepID=A0A914DA96_9BILA